LYTALASFLDARHQQGRWLLRIDDLDTPRNVSGASEAILNCLQRFGLHWDGEVYYQSQHLADYQSVITQLITRQQVYPCLCSRKSLELAGATSIYPGYCRLRKLPLSEPYALRLKTDDCLLSFCDRLQGTIAENIGKQHGDFVIQRKDGIIAYQFAVVIDDHLQGVNQVVRGMDLLDSTPKQQFLHEVLDLPLPHYMHIPLIVDEHGQKLSKQTLAQPVNAHEPVKTLFLLLQLLKQQPLPDLLNVSVAELLDWAIAHWQPQALKNIGSQTVEQSPS
jgi:glutamyl-Q tRNA(Asp) synthetase